MVDLIMSSQTSKSVAVKSIKINFLKVNFHQVSTKFNTYIHTYTHIYIYIFSKYMHPYHEHHETRSTLPGHGAKTPQVCALPAAGAEQNQDAVQGLQIQL